MSEYCSSPAGIIVVKPLHYWEDDVEPRTLQYNYGHWSSSLPHLGLGTFTTIWSVSLFNDIEV